MRIIGLLGQNCASGSRQKSRLDRTTTPGQSKTGLVTARFAAVEGAIASDDDLTTARALYRQAVASNPDRVVLLRDRARVLARSDRPETMLE